MLGSRWVARADAVCCVEPNYRRCVKAVGEREKLSDPCAPLPTAWGRGKPWILGPWRRPEPPLQSCQGWRQLLWFHQSPCAIARCPSLVRGRACAATMKDVGTSLPGVSRASRQQFRGAVVGLGLQRGSACCFSCTDPLELPRRAQCLCRSHLSHPSVVTWVSSSWLWVEHLFVRVPGWGRTLIFMARAGSHHGRVLSLLPCPLSSHCAVRVTNAVMGGTLCLPASGGGEGEWCRPLGLLAT